MLARTTCRVLVGSNMSLLVSMGILVRWAIHRTFLRLVVGMGRLMNLTLSFPLRTRPRTWIVRPVP